MDPVVPSKVDPLDTPRRSPRGARPRARRLADERVDGAMVIAFGWCRARARRRSANASAIAAIAAGSRPSEMFGTDSSGAIRPTLRRDDRRVRAREPMSGYRSLARCSGTSPVAADASRRASRSRPRPVFAGHAGQRAYLFGHAPGRSRPHGPPVAGTGGPDAAPLARARRDRRSTRRSIAPR